MAKLDCDGEHVLIASLRDITERKQMDELTLAARPAALSERYIYEPRNHHEPAPVSTTHGNYCVRRCELSTASVCLGFGALGT